MKEVVLIPCSGCGTLRKWLGYECLSGCPCLESDPQEESGDAAGSPEPGSEVE